MASLKTVQPCGHAWAWHVEGVCQNCRIEAAEKRIEELELVVTDIKPTSTPEHEGWQCSYCKWLLSEKEVAIPKSHARSCLWRRAQEALKGERQTDTEDAKYMEPLSTWTR